MATHIYFVTNRRIGRRNNKQEPVDGFTRDSIDLRYGMAEVAGSTLYKKDLDGIADSLAVSLFPDNAGTHNPGSRRAHEALLEELKQGKQLLFAIHGYNYTFRDAAARFLQLTQWLNDGSGTGFTSEGPDSLDRDVVILAFCWPSLGAGVAPATYKTDRQLAKNSGASIGRSLLKLRDFVRGLSGEDRVHCRFSLLTHSMGNWALGHALESIGEDMGETLPRLFDQAILTAADASDDALEPGRRLHDLTASAGRTTVYYNNQDFALIASSAVVGEGDRLGREGPDELENLPGNVIPVNVSPAINWDRDAAGAAWERDATGHQYYRNNILARNDMVGVLNGHGPLENPFRRDRGLYYALKTTPEPELEKRWEMDPVAVFTFVNADRGR